RMRTHIHRMDLFLVFVANPARDQALSKDIALEQEIAIFLKRRERELQRARQARHALELLWRKIIDILVERLARIDLVLYSVDSCHHHCCKCKIWIAARIRRTKL